MELPERKPTRLKKYDYSRAGAYFITICVQQRRSILSSIVGEGSPLPKLSVYGKITDDLIRGIPEEYPKIKVDEYVIMPNHIHLLLSIPWENGRGDPSPTVDAAIGWLKYQATKRINQIRGTPGESVFQRSFFDHIVRNNDDYRYCWRYIKCNPINWGKDKFYIAKTTPEK